MNKRSFLLFPILLSLACASTATPTAAEPPQTSEPAIEFDCTADSPDCPQIVIAGEEPALLPNGEKSPFRGFADPSVRSDPVTGTLWMAYSVPNMYVLNNNRPSPGVAIHLASSVDGGATWQYQGVLWDVQAFDNPTNNEAGTLDHEVANLLSVKTDSGLAWYAVRLDYFLPENGAFKARPFDSFHLVFIQAGSPPALANAESIFLSTNQTAPEWNADVNLSALSDDLARCDMWNEPALHYADGELYLALRCLVFSPGGLPLVEQSDIVIFAAQPAATIRDIQWRYVGILADGEDAKELGGDGITQIDLAPGMDGQLLLILSPDAWSSEEKDFVHYGCKIIEVESLDPPVLKRDSEGNLIVRAVITASDSSAVGSAACAYDHTSATGVIIGRRIKTSSFMEVWLHATGLNP